MKAALMRNGYFYASGVDVLPRNYISQVYDYLGAIHNLPIDVKRKYVQGGPIGGSYSGSDVGGEHAELDYEAGSKSSVCAWDYSRCGDYDSYPGDNHTHPLPAFGQFVDDLYERQNKLGSALMVAFAEMFDLPPDTFQQHFVSGDLGTIRLLNYPGTVDEEDASAFDHGISPHTDFEVFTLMHQDASGLQLISPAEAGTGESGLNWVDAPVRPGEFVVIVGDVLERFTNGVLRATPHRVLQTQVCSLG
jgi:isopenicillin N synthase-like dioxygenase